MGGEVALILPHWPGLLSQEKLAVLQQIRARVNGAGGRCYLVGGCVRDALLGKTLEELDLEMFGIEPKALMDCLEGPFKIDLVGRSFGVLKIKGLPVDISLPRRERKTGEGHRDFAIDADPHMSLQEACLRRDFTINAMSLDLQSNELIDHCGGRADLEAGLLRHVSPRFAEDPLRVLRGAQLLARFALNAHPGTIALCRSIPWQGLSPERIFAEMRKLLLKGRQPGRGMHFLADCQWLGLFPELIPLQGCPQNPTYHPEGDVWIHTCHVLDAFAGERLGLEEEDLIVGLACLCHDLGKPATTRLIDGVWRSPKHEMAGLEPTRSLLGRFVQPTAIPPAVLPLVRFHLAPYFYFRQKAGAGAIRRLAQQVGRLDRLVRLARADHLGRPPLHFDRFEAGEWLLQRAAELKVLDAAPEPLILGRHLIQRGLKPGPHFKSLLSRCYEAQLDGCFQDEAGGLCFLDEWLAQKVQLL